jgi:hypothetical protein
MEHKYDLSDLITATVEQKPNDFEDVFKSLMVNKLNDAIDARKIEIAQNMFNGQVTDEE